MLNSIPEGVDPGARVASVDDDGEFGRSAGGKDLKMRTKMAEEAEKRRIRVLLGDLGLGEKSLRFWGLERFISGSFVKVCALREEGGMCVCE